MQPKPAHLGPEYGAQFADPSVVAAYHLRPPYPPETFDVLLGLVGDGPRVVLDAGCGTGELARRLAGCVDRVDALDPSVGMLAKGRGLPGGASPNLTWIRGIAEDAPLRGPYSLIVAGASLHWMAWDVVLPRFRDLLIPGGVVAIVDDRAAPNPWDAALRTLIAWYSTNRAYQPYDLIEELAQRNLFRVLGRHETAPVAFAQPLTDYVESFHARNGLSRDRMDPTNAAAFDREVADLVAPHAPEGIVRLRVLTSVIWGEPASSAR